MYLEDPVAAQIKLDIYREILRAQPNNAAGAATIANDVYDRLYGESKPATKRRAAKKR